MCLFCFYHCTNISEKQFGFLNQRSTISQLIAYQNKLVFNSLNGLDTHSVYIDFQRAFDTVPINKLIISWKALGYLPN
ncbi:Protein CBG27388 [Caenorhabditis briggsae]|uniref:Protein CBG27388 n=1 Tax=Caenorhabditis briggsae TaxID=6238 RepID=B6IH04_CAEBR|nr:Protein CBG27388 [Caenorhabditis briggsae]CAR99184.1 Protein CBG27388 [Caenorhabditis briggsae]